MFTGKNVLITDADQFVGPACAQLFAAQGANVIVNNDDLSIQANVDRLIAQHGHIDVLIANFFEPSWMSPVHEIKDENWSALITSLVDPLMKITRAVSPQMIARKQGKIVLIGSASPVEGAPGGSAYAMARGAQHAFMKSVGLELARHNINVNTIALGYIRASYYPEDLISTPKFKYMLDFKVPLGRLAEPSEVAELASFLSSDKSRFMAAQTIPFSGGSLTLG